MELVARSEVLQNARVSAGLDGSKFDGKEFDCPLKGKRGPEMAAGHLEKLVVEMGEALKGDVILACSALSGDQQERILNDYSLGVQYVAMTLEIKIGHWKTLPWALSAMALPHEACNHNKHAARLIAEFQKLPCMSVHHHPTTWKVFAPGGLLRRQLDRLALDPLVVLPQLPELYEQVCRLAFIPVVERIVEGQHSLVHRHTGYRKVTGAYISTALRLAEMDELLSRDDSCKRGFVAEFEALRHSRRLVKSFRLQEHPQWQALVCKPKAQQVGVRKLCNAMLYSTDVSTMFIEHTDVRKRDEVCKKQRATAKKGLGPAEQEVCRDNLLAVAHAEAVLQTLEVGEFYSIVASAVSTPSVVYPLQPGSTVPRAWA